MNKRIFLFFCFSILALTAFSQEDPATVRTREVLQNWFQTGDKPTQQQFYDWMYSFWHKTQDTIPLTNIVGIDGTLSTDATLSTASNRQVSSTLALKTYIDAATAAAGVNSFNSRTGTVVPASNDYQANQITFTPISGIVATNTQSAIAELQAEKADTARMAGGDVSGTLSSMQLRTGVVGATELAATSVVAGTYGNSTNYPQVTVDADGRVTAITNQSFTGLTDGDKVDVDVSASGATWTVDTAAITLVKMAANSVDSTKIAAGTLGVTDPSAALLTYIRQPALDSITAHRTDITNLQTLSGRPDGATNLGTMSQGTQYPDNLNIKVFADSTDAKLGRVQPSIATLPAGFAITTTEKMASSDSTYTFQKQVNQLRDSTIFSAPTYTDIRKISTTLKVGDRIKVKDTGAEYKVQASAVSGYTTDTIAVIPVAGGNYAVMEYGNAYLLSAFNVKSTNDSITNRINLQRAMNFAGATSNPNILCDQTAAVKLLSTTSITWLWPGKSLHMIGRDTSITQFDIYPKNVGTTITVVFAFAQSANSDQLGTVEFSDVKILMPTAFTLPVSNVSAFTLLAGGMDLTLRRVAIRNGGKMSIYFGGANTDDNLTRRVLTIIDSHIEASTATEAVNIQYTGGRWENYLYCTNTKFTGGGSTGHQLYVQPWLNWNLDNCTFGVGTAVGSAQLFQANQSLGGTWPSWVPTKFQIFKNCTFVAGSYAGINLDKNYFPGLLVDGCNFYNTGYHMDVKNYGTVSNCLFNGGYGIRFNTDEGAGGINVTNCQFINDSGVGVSGGTALKSIKVDISNSTFFVTTEPIFSSTLSSTDTTSVFFNISNCSIISSGSVIHPIYIGNDVAGTKAVINLNNCLFEGETTLMRSGSNFKVYVNGGTFVGSSDFYTNTITTPTGSEIEIRNLRLNTYTNTPAEDRAPYTDKTCARAKWYLPEYVWPQNVTIPSDNVPDSLNIGYGLYNISDPSTRDSITSIQMTNEVTAYSVSTNDRYWGKYLRGNIKLRAINAFKLGVSGNINLTTPYQVAQNEIVELRWDFNTLEWQCLNCDDGISSLFYGNTPLANGDTIPVAGDGIYGGDGTTPTDVDVAVTDSINFDNGTLFLNGVLNTIGIGTVSPLARLSIRTDAIGVTQAESNGLLLRNATAATSGNQQTSPPITLESQGWKTTATAASQTVKAQMDLLPVQGSTSPAGILRLRFSVNGGAYEDLFQVRNDGSYFLGSNATRPIIMTVNGQSSPVSSGTALQFAVDNSSSRTSTGFDFLFTSGERAYTSGNVDVFRIIAPFSPTSGSGTFRALALNNTINQTGGASGTTRGIYINPTLTAAADWRSIETSNNTGYAIYAAGTAPSFFGGSVTLSSGIIQSGVNTITASGTTAITDVHYYIRIDATTGAQTYTLPTATLGRTLVFKRIDNNAATVITFTGTVDGTVNPTSTGGGSPIAALASQYGSITLIGNGTNFDQL